MRFLSIFVCVLVGMSSAFAYSPEDIVPNEVIVKFKDNRRGGLAVMGKLAADNQLKSQRAWPGLNMQRFSTRPGAKVEDVIKDLQQDPNVEFVEPNFWVKSSDISYPMTSSTIKIVESWKLLPEENLSNDIPIVAIIDSGLDLTHSVYNNTGRVFKNTKEIPNNGKDDDGNGYVDDVNGWNFVSNSSNMLDDTGHGTHVSGIVLGVTEDIFNFKPNAAPRVKILPLKFLNKDGFGKTSDAIDAIYYSISVGVKVINNSWGGESYSATLHSALNAAYQKGIVIVAAAGNDRSNNDIKAVYPASMDVPSMISVAASSYGNDIAGFSNYGSASTHVFAPGVSILSTYPGDRFGVNSGTSMAAPFVSGLAAILTSLSPQLSGYQIKEIITDGGDYKTNNLNYVMSGSRINFQKAITTSSNYANLPYYQPVYSPLYKYGQRSLASSENTTSGFGCGRVSAFYDDQNKNLFKSKKKIKPIEVGTGIWFLLLPFLMIFGYRRKFFINKRSNARRKVNVPSQLVLDNGWVLPVMIKDVSATGAGVQVLGDFTNYKFSPSSGVILNMISGSKGKSNRAQIMRCTETGFLGIKFSKD